MVIRLLGGIENDVTVTPGYVTVTTLIPGYLRTAQGEEKAIISVGQTDTKFYYQYT